VGVGDVVGYVVRRGKMRTLFIWTLCIVIVIITIWFILLGINLPSSKYQYKMIHLPTTCYNSLQEIGQLKQQGWRVDDLNFDSCGNAYVMMVRR